MSERVTPERSSPGSSQLSSLMLFNRSGFLSVLSSPGRDGDGDGGHGTTVAFWPTPYTSHSPFFFTHAASHRCVYGPTVRVECSVRRHQHICPWVTENSHNHKLKKGTSQKDRVLPVYSIFIYLFNSPNLYSQQEGFTQSMLAHSQ